MIVAETHELEIAKRAGKVSRLRAIEKTARNGGALMLATGVALLGIGGVTAVTTETLAVRHVEQSNNEYGLDSALGFGLVIIGALAIGGGAYKLNEATSLGQQANLLEVGYELNPLPPEEPEISAASTE